MRKAYVLMRAEAPKNVVKGALSKLPGVNGVSLVECDGDARYNVVVELSAETSEELEENMNRVKRASFVMSSCTLTVLSS